jgi:hypothetical protein
VDGAGEASAKHAVPKKRFGSAFEMQKTRLLRPTAVERLASSALDVDAGEQR